MRKPITHRIKCDSIYFLAVKLDEKRFELRKDDRDYQVGDTIILHEVVNGKETGNVLLPRTIKYILRGDDSVKYGLQPGYCIIQLDHTFV